MPKKIVICCDGTANQLNDQLSNVLKFYRILQKTNDQLVYYSPGVGTGSAQPIIRASARFDGTERHQPIRRIIIKSIC